MDLPRYLLIAAIAALSFMLLTEWVAFREEHATSGTPANSPVALQPDTSNTPVIGVAGQTGGENDDLPVIEQGVETSSQVAAPTTTSGGAHIQINSDVLQMTIDLRGGDINVAQ